MKILVPIDFSENAIQAFRIALEFARKFDATIDLLHVIVEEFTLSDEFSFFSSDDSEEYRKKINDFLKKVTKQDNYKARLKKLKVKSFISFGDPKNIIIRSSEDYDMLIMGAKGEGKADEKILGSITEFVINNANCPVMSVPVNIEEFSIDKFILCEDFDQLDLETLDFFEKLNDLSSINIKFYHAVEVKDNENNLRIHNHSTFKKLVKKKLSSDEFFYDREVKPLPDAIIDHIQKSKAPILALVLRQQEAAKNTNLVTEVFRRGQTIILSFPKTMNYETVTNSN